MKKPATDIGSRLREVREYLNLTQQFVSDQCGIPRTAISAIESGKRRVDSTELAGFARLYNYPVSYFLRDSDISHDNTLAEVYRAAGSLDESDRRELVRFAEFLRYSGKHNRTNREPDR